MGEHQRDEGASPLSGGPGRYLYCVVAAEEATASPVPVDGLDGGDPYLVTSDGIGAVVQHCDGLYDSEDPAQVKRWLLQHQGVVDAATDQFGTPLPVRFDTVLSGEDDQVRAWLADRRETLSDALDRVAGLREYRVEVRCSDDAFGGDLTTEDDELAALQSAVEDATEGTAYMKRRQYERQIERAIADRWAEEMESLAASLADHAETVRPAEATSSTLREREDREEADRSTTLALLADPERESAIGECLDETAALPGVEVRFTGPWAPYSFTPTLEADE